MAIYISQKAVSKIPDELSSTYLPKFLRGKLLRSNYFKDNIFFKSLAEQGQGADTLKKDGDNDVSNVLIIQLAVSAVLGKLGLGDPLNTDGYFEDKTEAAIVLIQQHFNLAPTGELNSETLIAIDDQLAGDSIFNSGTGVFHGNFRDARIAVNESGSSIEVFEEINNNNTTSEFEIGIGEVVRIIEPSNVNFTDDAIVFLSDTSTSEGELNQENAFYLKDREGILKPIITEQPEPGARLVKIEPGETITSIIYREYYNEEYPILRQPNINDPSAPENDITNPDNLIHTFPKRDLKKDTRLKFITNMLFHMNYSPFIANGVELKGGYDIYTDEDLDEINIYDNENYDLNYQVFLEKLAQKNSNYDWDFIDDSSLEEGFNAPIEFPEGAQVWIPSRTYVEGLYYSMNFQPKNERMYTQKTRVNAQGEQEQYMDWPSVEEEKTFLDKAEDYLFETLGYANEKLDDIKETYEEALAYFKKMHNWIQDIAETGWPRGFGGAVEGGVSASVPVYGLPLTGNLQGDTYILRKVTNDEDFLISYREKIRFGVGLAGGLSTGSFGIGGKGKSTKNIGAGKGKNSEKEIHYGVAASITLEATLNVEMTSVYEFDISKGNTPLIAMAVAMFENTLKDNTVTPSGYLKSELKKRVFDLSEYFFSINIDPDDYLVYNDVGLYAEGRLYGDAYIGNIPDPNKWGAENTKKVDQLKWGGITSLLSKLGGASGSTDNFIRFGGKYTYKAEYGNIAEVYDADFRMPSKSSIEGEIFYEFQAGFDVRFNDFLVRFITGLLTNLTGTNFLTSFNLHVGIAIVYNLEYTRTDTAENHVFFNHEPDTGLLYGVKDPDGNIVKKVGFKIASGDVETPLEPASELVYLFEFAKIKEFLLQAQNDRNGIVAYVTNIDTLVQLFSKFTIRKRILIGDGITNRASKKAKRAVQSQKSKSRTFYKDSFKDDKSNFVVNLLNNKNIDRGSFETALDVEATINMVDIVDAFKFVYEYLRFVVSEVLFTGEELIKYKKAEVRVAKIMCSAKSNLSVISDGNIATASLNEVFKSAISELETIYTEEVLNRDTLRSYTSVIGDFIKTMDQEGVLSTIRDTPATIFRTVSPYLTEIEQLLKQVIVFLATKSELNVNVENKLAFSTGGGARLPIEGYKVSFGFYASGAIYSKIEVLEKGEFSAIFKPDDPYFSTLQAFVGVLGVTTSGPLGLSAIVSNLLIGNTANKTQPNENK